MKNLNNPAKSIHIILLVVLTCGIVFSACHKKDDPVIPPIIPVVKDVYAIHGIVTNMKNEIIPGAIIKLRGVISSNSTTNNKGEFTFNALDNKGKYSIEVSKSGYITVITNIDLNSTLINTVIQLPYEAVKATVEPTKDTQLILQKENSATNVGAILNIPAGSLSHNKEVSVTETPDITINKTTALVVLNYQPDGTTFHQPCALSVEHQLDEYELNGIKLQWLNPATQIWEDQPQPVTYDGTFYTTTITHFSSYKLSGFSQEKTSLSTENIHSTSVDNLNGNSEVKIDGVPYTYKRGTVFVTTPEAAAAAAGISNKKVIDFIKSAVYAEKTFIDVDVIYAINVTIPAGVRMDIKGTQAFTTINYIFSFKKGKKIVNVSLATKTAGAVSVNTVLYTKEHTGGSGF